MRSKTWFKHFPGAITITDENAIIVEMNDASAETFNKDGGFDLIGQSVIDCHPKSVQDKVRELYQSQSPNAYTIEKDGKKKLIYQTPFFEDGKLAGVVEMSLPLPDSLPHFNRDAQ
jgi:transcriptional regulator with PAS, ATPase and Fis domain